jgi:hypothetical protein
MDKGYYKDPRTGETKKGSFENAWKSFIDKIKDRDDNIDPYAKNTFIKDKIKEILKDKLTEDKPCWKGYKQIGTKTKKGKEVPNCVPNKKK